ncbi:hypothetical protein ACRAWF_33850 [Streptomyces sp. L7]
MKIDAVTGVVIGGDLDLTPTLPTAPSAAVLRDQPICQALLRRIAHRAAP